MRYSPPNGIAVVLMVIAATSPVLAQESSTSPSTPTPAAPPPLSESLTGMAKAEYEAGRILVQDGDYANALIKFQQAYNLSKDYRLLWNMAACEKNLRHYVRALEVLEQYRNEAAGKVGGPGSEQVAALQQTLRSFISDVIVVVDEPNTTIVLDDASVGVSPLLAPLRVDVGSRVFRFEKKGFKPLTVNRTVNGGSQVTVSVKLEKERHQGRLVVEAGPKDVIALDGKMVGLERYDAVVPSGGHTLRVSAPGMATFQTDVLVQDNETRRMPVSLNPLPTDMRKWLWVGGGATLLVGAVVAGVLIFKPTEAPTAQGTLGTYPLTFGGR